MVEPPHPVSFQTPPCRQNANLPIASSKGNNLEDYTKRDKKKHEAKQPPTPIANAGFLEPRDFAREMQMQMQCSKHSLSRSLTHSFVPLLLPPCSLSPFLPFSHCACDQSPDSEAPRDRYLLRSEDPLAPPSSPPACTSAPPSNTGRNLCIVTASATSSASSLLLAKGVGRRRRR